MAIHRDDIGFVHWFIDHMASFNLRPNGCKSNTPLTEAVIYASIDIVHLLVLTAFAWARATNYIPFQSIFNHIAMMSSPSSSRRVHRSTSSRMSTTRAGSRSRSSLAWARRYIAQFRDARNGSRQLCWNGKDIRRAGTGDRSRQDVGNF